MDIPFMILTLPIFLLITNAQTVATGGPIIRHTQCVKKQYMDHSGVPKIVADKIFDEHALKMKTLPV